MQVAVMALGALCITSCWSISATVAKESLRILPQVGIVLTSTSAAGFKLCRFLEWEHAGPIIINEVSAAALRQAPQALNFGMSSGRSIASRDLGVLQCAHF